MKCTLLLFFLSVSGYVRSQHQFSLYEDNDFFNVLGKGTDKAYTNGTRLGYYDARHTTGQLRWPAAGKGSVNVYAITLTQLMFTPNNITSTDYQYSDYPYAGALYLGHSLLSSHPARHFSFQTSLLAGIRGPAALGMEAQTAIHRMIGYRRPMGWKYQQHNRLLANISFTTEKRLAHWQKVLELMGGTEVQAGTMINSATAYSLLRIGKMQPYFNGYFSRYAGEKHSWQAYAILRPHASLIASNTLLESRYPPAGGKDAPPDTEISTGMAGIDYGVVLAVHGLAVAYTQKQTTAYLRRLYGHNVGNFSFYFTW